MSSNSFVFVCVDGSGCQIWEFLAIGQLISPFFQDQEKQQISFFVKHFPVKNSDRLVTTAAQNVLDFQFLK